MLFLYCDILAISMHLVSDNFLILHFSFHAAFSPRGGAPRGRGGFGGDRGGFGGGRGRGGFGGDRGGKLIITIYEKIC